MSGSRSVLDLEQTPGLCPFCDRPVPPTTYRTKFLFCRSKECLAERQRFYNRRRYHGLSKPNRNTLAKNSLAR